MSALLSSGKEGGTWHADLSLAQTAHWLLTAPQPDEADARGEAVRVDASAYLARLPSADGTVAVVRPPGSPVWRHAAVLPGRTTPTWEDRQPPGSDAS